MPRTKKVQAQSSEPIEEPTDVGHESTPLSVSKDEYKKAREAIKQYKEAQKNRPKRPCSEKQLAALAKGRSMNKRFANKTTGANQ